MTPARKAAMQWFHDRGEFYWPPYTENPPSNIMVAKMQADGQLQYKLGKYRQKIFTLTDKGRRMLHGDDK